jgi:hypothetical protein
VRLKSGTHAGARGFLESLDDEKLVVRLEDSGLRVRVTPEQITNFSLAARKAWVTERDRAVAPLGNRGLQPLFFSLGAFGEVASRFTRTTWPVMGRNSSWSPRSSMYETFGFRRTRTR